MTLELKELKKRFPLATITQTGKQSYTLDYDAFRLAVLIKGSTIIEIMELP